MGRRRRRIGIASGVVVVALLTIVAVVRAAPGAPLGRGTVPPRDADKPYCLSLMQPDDAPPSPAMRGTVEAFATATGKPVSVERAAEHVCFATTQERDDYAQAHGIVGATGP